MTKVIKNTFLTLLFISIVSIFLLLPIDFFISTVNSCYSIKSNFNLLLKRQEIATLKHPNNSKRINLSTYKERNNGSSDFCLLRVKELRSFKGDRNKLREYYNSIGVLPNSKASDLDGEVYIVFINVVEKITNNNIDEDYEEWTFSGLKTKDKNVTDLDRKSNFYYLVSSATDSY